MISRTTMMTIGCDMRTLIRFGMIALVTLLMIPAGLAAPKNQKPKAPKITLKDCPEAVRKTVKAKAGDAPVVEIEKYAEQGDVEFCVTVKQGGRLRDHFVGAAGDYRGWEEVWALKACPSAVQKTIKAKAGKAAVLEIVKEDAGDGVQFSVAIKQGGQEREFAVAPGGKFIGWASATVTLKDCPAPVQKTIKQNTGDAAIVEINREDVDGDIEYVVTIKQDGKERDMFVAPDGKFLGWEEEVSLADCPEAVQKTIKDKAGAATVMLILKETEGDGSVEYAVTIKQDDNERDFTVGSDGKFVGWEDEEATDNK